MGRIFLLILMLIISGVIYLVKAGVGKVTGKEVNFQDESKKVMQTTARGLNWMNEQWEKAKASTSGQATISNGKSAQELIAQVKANPETYDPLTTEAFFIEQAVLKMNSSQYSEAALLVMQLPEGESRDFMLKEIQQKSKAAGLNA